MSPEYVTWFSVPYENNRSCDIHILCSQVEGYPQFKTSAITKFEAFDQLLKKVSKESLVLHSTHTVKEDNILDSFILTGLNQL